MLLAPPKPDWWNLMPSALKVSFACDDDDDDDDDIDSEASTDAVTDEGGSKHKTAEKEANATEATMRSSFSTGFELSLLIPLLNEDLVTI